MPPVAIAGVEIVQPILWRRACPETCMFWLWCLSSLQDSFVASFSSFPVCRLFDGGAGRFGVYWDELYRLLC